MSFATQIEQTRFNLRKKRFENELQYTNNPDECFLENEVRDKRKKQLETIINNLQQVETEEKTDKFFHEVDRLIYKKPWNRLQPFHRWVKMEPYLDEEFDGYSFLDNLKKEMKTLILSGKLHTAKHVKYSPTKETVLDILVLKVDNKANSYKINM